jgi:hypothetical protein
MKWSVWKVQGQRASEITAPADLLSATCTVITLNAHAPDGVHYQAVPLGGSPFDA